MGKDKYWRHDNSIEASDLTPEQRAKIRKNKAKFEDDQRALETWAAGGFTPAFDTDQHPLVFDDEGDI